MLGRYVRDEKVLDLATAIHRMTGMSARKFLNGVAVARDGVHTGARPGRALRRGCA